MRISSSDAIEGGRILYPIGKIEAASPWHGPDADGDQENWRELALRGLVRQAEDIDADAIIGLAFQTVGVVPVEGSGLNLRRVQATGIAVKLSLSSLAA